MTTVHVSRVAPTDFPGEVFASMQLRKGAQGSAVAEVRRMLATLGLLDNTGPLAETFDEATELAVRHFQQQRGISVDGSVGPETYGALVSAHWKLGDRVLAHDSVVTITGDDVTALQEQLLELGYDVVRPDGVFGPTTAAGLRQFQRDSGLVADGVFGPVTLHALRLLGRRVTGGRPQWLRESLRVAASGPSLLGKRIVLDPGHGGADPGVNVDGYDEASIVWDLVSRLEGRLAALGVKPWLTRGPNTTRSDAERAALANELSADLVVSIHVDGFTSPAAHGLATYYFGNGASGAHSTIGERLAELVQHELVARTGLGDNRTHGKTWSLLRLTKMPTVRVELGYLTCPGDRARLVDPQFRDTVAEGLLVAIQRLYLPQADDPGTGVMQMPAAV
jgi:N-acetylmuramoyl-L-alanine amidase